MSVEKFNSKTTVSHELIPYTQINRKVIQKIDNMQAGFVWVYLLSMPPDWVVIKTQIKKHFKMGNDKLKKIFAYLTAHGLIRTEPVKDPNTNRIMHWNITVLNGSEFIEKPDKPGRKATGSKIHPLEIPPAGKQDTTYKIKSYKDEKKKQRELASRFALSDFENKPFKFNDADSSLLDNHSIGEGALFNKFRVHLLSKGRKTFTDYDLKMWILREIEYLQKPKNKKNQTRCTVPDFVTNEDDKKKYSSRDTAKENMKAIKAALGMGGHKGTIKS